MRRIEKLKKVIHENPSGPNTVGYIYVGDHENSISQSTWLYIKQALTYYKAHPPRFIILELDTPGGEVFAAQKISDALLDDLNVPKAIGLVWDLVQDHEIGGKNKIDDLIVVKKNR